MNIQRFIDKFQFKKLGFSDPVAFSDAIGFSTSKDRLQNGVPFVSIYKFFLRPEDLNNSVGKKPVIISVSYAEKLNDGTLRISPTSIKRRLNWPIDLFSKDEFFYDLSTEKFYFKEREITTEEIVRTVEALHTKPTKLIRGFILKCKLFFWRILVTNILKLLYYSLIKILYVFSGTKTEKSIWLVNISRDKFDEDRNVKKESFAEEKIDIFGYHASAWSVVVYAILHLSIYTIWYFKLNFENGFIKSIFSNAFLTTVYVIPSLVFFERLFPNVLEFLIKWSGEYFHRASYKQIKI